MRSLPEKINKAGQQKIITEILQIKLPISMSELFKACFLNQGCAKARQQTGSCPTTHNVSGMEMNK